MRCATVTWIDLQGEDQPRQLPNTRFHNSLAQLPKACRNAVDHSICYVQRRARRILLLPTILLRSVAVIYHGQLTPASGVEQKKQNAISDSHVRIASSTVSTVSMEFEGEMPGTEIPASRVRLARKQWIHKIIFRPQYLLEGVKMNYLGARRRDELKNQFV